MNFIFLSFSIIMQITLIFVCVGLGAGVVTSLISSSYLFAGSYFIGLVLAGAVLLWLFDSVMN